MNEKNPKITLYDYEVTLNTEALGEEGAPFL